MNTLMCLMTTMGLILLMSSSLQQGVEAKKPKKYIGENGGDFEFIDEVSKPQHKNKKTTNPTNNPQKHESV